MDGPDPSQPRGVKRPFPEEEEVQHMKQTSYFVYEMSMYENNNRIFNSLTPLSQFQSPSSETHEPVNQPEPLPPQSDIKSVFSPPPCKVQSNLFYFSIENECRLRADRAGSQGMRK